MVNAKDYDITPLKKLQGGLTNDHQLNKRTAFRSVKEKLAEKLACHLFFWMVLYLFAIVLCFLGWTERMGRAFSSQEKLKRKETALSIRFLCMGMALIYLGFGWYNLPSVVEKRIGVSRIMEDITLYKGRRDAYPTPNDTAKKLWVLEGERYDDQ